MRDALALIVLIAFFGMGLAAYACIVTPA